MTQDELVERCKAAADKAEVEWTLRSARERMREALIEGIIRAIIPIVQDWQRERDAGIVRSFPAPADDENTALRMERLKERSAAAIREQGQ